MKKERKKQSYYWPQIEFWLAKGYSEEAAKAELERRFKAASQKCIGKNPMLPLYWTLRGYSEEDAIKEAKKKSVESSVRCVEYWIARGHSKEQAVDIISDIQSKCGLKASFGKTKDDLRKRSHRCVEYWIARGYSEEEAKNKVHDVHSCGTTLKGYVAKYGQEEGSMRYNLFLDETKKRNSLARYIEKYGEDEGVAVYSRKYRSHRKYNSGASNSFFSSLYSMIREHFPEMDDSKIYFDPKTNEFTKFDKVNRCVYFYDFVISDLKLAIEFNGLLWHANPSTYSGDDLVPVINKKASDVWDYDKRKIDLLKSEGFSVFVVWECRSKVKTNDNLQMAFDFIKEKISEKN